MWAQIWKVRVPYWRRPIQSTHIVIEFQGTDSTSILVQEVESVAPAVT